MRKLRNAQSQGKYMGMFFQACVLAILAERVRHTLNVMEGEISWKVTTQADNLFQFYLSRELHELGSTSSGIIISFTKMYGPLC